MITQLSIDSYESAAACMITRITVELTKLLFRLGLILAAAASAAATAAAAVA